MKYLHIFLLTSLYAQQIFTQCIEGNCENGFGVMDLSYCIYEGYFEEGVPHGKGSMFYDDYKYIGEVNQGFEHGKGKIIYKNGKIEDVIYENGKRKERKYIKSDPNKWRSFAEIHPLNHCKSGNCENGFGEYQDTEGNRYIGNFKDHLPHGNGEWKYPNGDRYKGNFKNGIKEGNGTYYFANGWVYKGIYKDDDQYTGTYTTSGGKTVNQTNGVVEMPKYETITYTSAPKEVQCAMCYGIGKFTTLGKLKKEQGSASYNYYRDRNGYVKKEYAGPAPVVRSREPGKEIRCQFCNGTGKTKIE